MKRLSFDNLETDEVIVSMSFSDSNNTVFMVTNLGNAILFNLNTNKVLKFNDQLLNIKNETAVEIEFYSGTVFIGTQEGSIYIYDYQKNNSLKYLNSIRANFSKINDLLYDQKNIHVITENGDLTVIPYSKNGSNSDEVKIKTPVSINFGDNNFGNAIESFTYGGVQYFVTADRSGNLVYWDLDLESTFDEIKKIHAEKYNDM
jgi:WD40 repeat protein